MARFPGATWRPIPEYNQQPLVRVTQVILHVAASNGPSLFNWWNTPGNNLESHLYVTKAGPAEQYVDSSRSADANLTANYRDDGTGALSVETEGLADEEWTDAQLDQLVAIIRWAHEVHGVPLRVCSGPDDPGIGWHVMFGAPGPWTNVSGKVCPGPNRVKQFNDIIMPRVLGGEEDDVALSDADKAWLRSLMGAGGDKSVTGVVEAVYNKLHGELVDLRSRVDAIDGGAPGGDPADVADAVVGAFASRLSATSGV